MILNAALLEGAVEKERSVIIEEIKMYMDLPGHFVADLLGQLMWPNHPLGMFLTGTPQTLKAITRRDLVDYKMEFYSPSSIVITAASSLGHDAVVKSCSKYFEKLSPKKVTPFKPASDIQDKPRVNLQYKDTEQMHLAMGLPAVSALDPDRFIVNILHIILGANMSSRLFQEIREKRGLAYEISTAVKKYKDTGAFMVSGGIKNERLPEAVEVILQELKRIRTEQPADSEIRRAKEFYTGQMLMALEDTADHMLWAGEQTVQTDKIFTSQEILRLVDKVTAADVTRVADRFFKSQKLNLAVIGPVKDKDTKNINKILETLG
jgi:predicted Zn-dependent peptidase